MRVCQYIMAQKQQSYSPPVLKALQYITANSQTPTLSLDDISDNVGLSSGRFSTLFKTETGMTFTDYLLKTRMEKAKELMLNPNKKFMKSPWNPVMTTFPISVLLLENIRDILHLNTGIRYDSKRNNRLFSTGLPLIKSRFLYFLIF